MEMVYCNNCRNCKVMPYTSKGTYSCVHPDGVHYGADKPLEELWDEPVYCAAYEE